MIFLVISLQKLLKKWFKRLDDVISDVVPSVIKIGVQGAALMILQNAPVTLSKMPILHLETSSLPMYVDQPSMFEIGQYLERKDIFCIVLLKKTK